MANPLHHSISATRKWGGAVDDYMPIHRWFDESKAHHGDFRHRALRHHAEGIFLMESIFGPTLTLSTCAKCGLEATADVHALYAPGTGAGRLHDEHAFEAKVIPTRWIGEQHVLEDLGRIPAATEWLSAIKPAGWMNRSRKLSRELEAK